jgi:ABC-2 type transport system ATP-binding protein
MAVSDLTLEVLEGEVFAFLGPNGAGKTTAIHMMCGLLRPDGGRVMIRGRPLHENGTDVRSCVGLCPQEVVLWMRLTAIEQLTFIGRMYGLTGTEARRAGEQLLDELDLMSERSKQVHTLSGGMKRRLNLAMALVHNPDIVVLDEPEAGLDPQSRIRVREFIRRLGRHKTVILTTHNMDEADRLADRLAIIDHGRLLVLDTPDALKRRVGEGDVLEIAFDGRGDDAEKALAHLGGPANIVTDDGIVTVRALNAVSLLPAIVETMDAAALPCGEIRLRQNTLEDVFIQLTGRRLRQ